MYILQAHYTSSYISTIALGDQSKAVSQRALLVRKAWHTLNEQWCRGWDMDKNGWYIYTNTESFSWTLFNIYRWVQHKVWPARKSKTEPYFAFM